VSREADVCVFGGAGHVGLPLALVFASRGLHVIVYDRDEAALEKIRRGVVPFTEEGAEPLLARALREKRLTVSSDIATAGLARAVVITIGTPVDEYMNPALRAMEQAMTELLPHLRDGQLVILRSTVYPGTTDWLDKFFRSNEKQVKLAFCPERVMQGRAIEEVQKLPQLISGTTKEAEDEAARLFELIAPETVRLSPMEAEFAKLFNNAYRYLLFAVANQFYMMTHSAGVDYYRVMDGMKKNYPRAHDIPGAGFAAGPCLLKDTMQLVAFSSNSFSLGREAIGANEGLVFYLVNDIARQYDLATLKVGLLGMAFKAESDDTRSSLSYKLKKVLNFRAASVLTTDPYVTSDPELLPVEQVVEQSDLLILCVPHRAYRGLDTRGKPVIDVWNAIQQPAAVAAGVG
jgi:UDP-N-acetyl-D-mannosaminuronic acid dehydrogenase